MEHAGRDTKYMRMAIAMARAGIRRGQTPFGACILKGKDMISCAHNVVWKTMDITAHAEIRAIRQACRTLKTVDLSGCVIYSTCEPCPMCFSACHWAKISKVVSGAKIQDARSLGFHEFPISNARLKKMGRSPIKIVENFLRDECLSLFQEWSRLKDKKAY